MRRILALGVLLAAACSTPAPAPARASVADQRKYLLERVDDAAVVQLYADGFSALPLDQKSSSGTWPRPRSPAATSSTTRSRPTRSRCVRCSRRSSRHAGEGRSRSRSRRFAATRSSSGSTPGRTTTSPRRSSCSTCTPQAFADAATRGRMAPARRFRFAPGETLDQLLTRLGPMFFDASFKPSRTNQKPRPGVDILAGEQQQPVSRA